ncbi:MAG: PD40 domain-containing protein [Chloroflexi bacterium]|nr:PD40 domain-containing protein [Chloroflexota bacterium]
MKSRSVYRLFVLLGLFILAMSLFDSAISRAQTPRSRRIESDDAQVVQNGTWVIQTATGASGGDYLYSSGNEADALTLAFEGSTFEVLYVAGPQLGTLALEVDGTVLRTVITRADKVTYGQSAMVNYLTDEPHTLKVYAQEGGIVAVDAFVIPQAAPIPSTATPSPSPQAVTVSQQLGDGGAQSSSCAAPHAIYRASVSSIGAEANNPSDYTSLSGDGRYVAFRSFASNLVAGDSNNASDAFVYDRLTCVISIVSVSSSGQLGNGNTHAISISADGRYVAFESEANNLVAGDTNGVSDIFVRDRQANTTIRISIPSPATGNTQTNGVSRLPAISGNGRFVAYESYATNMSTNVDANNNPDVFVYDLVSSITYLVSRTPSGAFGNGASGAPAISADGQHVVFSSSANDLVVGDPNGPNVDIFDSTGLIVSRIAPTAGLPTVRHASLSADGRYIAFDAVASNLVPNDTNGESDVFVYDRQTLALTRVSVSSNGVEGVALSDAPVISADGRYVAFESLADNLVPQSDNNGSADIFVRDRQTNTTIRLSDPLNGTQAAGESLAPSISADGHYVGFQSTAENLLPNDDNNQQDVFVTPSPKSTADSLAVFNPGLNQVNLLDTLQDNPPYTAYTGFSAYAPVSGGQWVMGDWNGDGLKTPGVYANGPFFYTNKGGESQSSDWRSLWIGISGLPVAGRFNDAVPNDCIGAVQSASFPPYGTAFVLYFTCDLSGNTAPAITYQWLSVVLPDSGGFSGVHQFGAGDFNGDGVDSIAVRRGTFIAFGNVPPTTNAAAFDLAQYIGAPLTSDGGLFVVGDWNGDHVDSFGLFYQSGELFYRNDLQFNSGAYGNQSIGRPFGGTVQVASWR